LQQPHVSFRAIFAATLGLYERSEAIDTVTITIGCAPPERSNRSAAG
jgi:hypothetical protein